MHVFGADFQGGAGITIAHALADTGGLRLGKLDAVQAQPGEALQMREDRLHEHVLHLHPLGAVGDNQTVRPEEAQTAELEILGDLPHRPVAVLQSDPPKVDPERLQTAKVRRQAAEELLQYLVVDEEQRAAAAADRRLVQRQVELAQRRETRQERQQQRSAQRQTIVHCHLQSEIISSENLIGRNLFRSLSVRDKKRDV